MKQYYAAGRGNRLISFLIGFTLLLSLSMTGQARVYYLTSSSNAIVSASVTPSPRLMTLDEGNNRGVSYEGLAVVRSIKAVRLTDGVVTPLTGLSLSCTALDVAPAPEVTTSALTAMSTTNAPAAGTVVGSGAPLTERGVVDSASNTVPTTSDSKTSIGSSIGAFTAWLTGLTSRTTYSVRAYSPSGTGTSYGAASNGFTGLSQLSVPYQAITAAPVVISPADGAYLSNPFPTYRGTAPAGSTVTVYLVDFRVDQPLVVGTALADAEGSFTLDQPTVLEQTLYLPEYKVFATAQLNDEAVSAQSNVNSFNVDLEKPVGYPSFLSNNYNDGSVNLSVSFSEPVTDFTASDIVPRNGRVSNFQGNGLVYTFTITPPSISTVQSSFSIPAGAVQDRAGNPTAELTSSSFLYKLTVSVSLSTPADGSVFSREPSTGLTSLTIAGSATPYSTVSIYRDNLAPITLETGATGNFYIAGYFEFTLASHTIYVEARVPSGRNVAKSPINTILVTDLVPPTVNLYALTGADGSTTSTSPIRYRAQFSEIVTGFEQSDISVSNGYVSDFVDDNYFSDYYFSVIPSGNGPVTVSIPGGVAWDQLGNNNVASSVSTIQYTSITDTPVVNTPADGDQPNTTTPTYQGSATAGSTVTIYVDGTSVGTARATAEGGFSLLQPTALSQGSHSVYATALADLGIGSANSATNTFTVKTVRPTVTVTSTAGTTTGTSPIPVTVTFSESVTGFVTGDMSVTNGAISGFSGSGTTYTFTVTPTGNGAVTVTVFENVAQNAAGNGNTASSLFSITYSQPVTVTPVLSTPVNGSLLNTVQPTYTGTVSAGSTVTVYVDDTSIGTATATGGNFSLEQPTALSQGSHTVYAMAQLSGQAVSANSNTNTFTVDAVRPSVGITSTAGATGSTTGISPIPFTVTFSEAVTGFVAGDLTVTNSTLSGFLGIGTTYSFNLTPAANGLVTVNLPTNVAQDAAGNANTAAILFAITYSQPVTAAPVVVSPANGNLLITATPAYTGTASSGSTVTVYVDGTSIGTTTATGGTFSLTQPTALAQGSHTVYVMAQLSGQTVSANSDTNTFTVDTVQPTVAIASTAAANGGTSSAGTFAYTVTFSEAVTGFVQDDISVDKGTISGFTAMSGATYTFTVTPAANGAVTVNVLANVAQDAASNGNTAAGSPYTITYSQPMTAAPVVVSPANGSLLNTDAPSYSGTAPSGSTVTVFVDGSSIGTTTAPGGNWFLAQPTALSQGSHTLRATAQGSGQALSGNSNTNTFSVDTVRPGVSISSTAGANGSTTGTSPIPFTVTFSEPVTGFVAGDLTLTNGSLSGFSGSGTAYSFNVTPSGNGQVTVNVPANVAQDAANSFNTASAPFSITYSQPVTAAPVVISPANGSLLGTATPTYTGTAPASSTVTVYVDGTPIGTTTAPAGSWSLTQPTALANTTHSVYATAQLSGQALSTNSSPNSFTVDPVRPTVSVTSTASNPTNSSPIPFILSFSEPVTGFVTGDLSVSNGTVSNFSGSGTSYSFNVTPLANGAVVVNVPANLAQDAAGNANTAAPSPYTITYSATPTITGFAADPAVVCVGSPFTFTATVGNLSPPYAFTLTNGSSTTLGTAASTAFSQVLTASGSGLQTFTLTVSSDGQSTTATTSLTVNALPVAGLQDNGPLSCSQPSVMLSASGGDTYRFSSGATQIDNGPTATVSSAGIYSVTVVSGNGCSSVASTTVAGDQSVPTGSLTNNGPISCSMTSVTLTASGGGTYQFSAGATQIGNGATATVSTAGVYSVTVISTNGCSATASTTVTDSGGSLIAFSGQPSSASTVTIGAVVTTPVSITSTGQNPGTITYQWYKNNLSSPVTSQTSATLTLTNVQLSDAGSYSVVAVGTCNSLKSAAFNLTVNPNAVPLSLSLTASPTLLLTSGSTTLSATVAGGTTGTPDRPYSYVFSGPGIITQTSTSNTVSVSGLPAGVQTFTVVVTDISTPTTQTISGTVSVTVSAANTPPVATANASQTATVGTVFAYTVTAFTDPEGQPLTYTTTINPANGLSFNPATRIISGTPYLSGVSSVTVVASDPGSLSASTSLTITVNPAPVTPTITVTPTNLTDFLYTTQSDGSGAQSYTVSASGLTAPLTITPPAPYLVSLDNNSFSPSLSIAAPNGTIAPTRVYVILVSSTAGTYTGTITQVSGTASASVAVRGEVRQATLTVTPTDLSNFTTTVGTPSAIQTYTVTTLNQTGGTITAPVGVEIRRPGPGAAFGSTASIDFSLSTTSFPVEVRLTGASAGPVSSWIMHTAGNPRPLTATVTVSGQVREVVEPPTSPFSITGVTTVSCVTITAGQRQVSFVPRYAGLSGQPISFSVVNELSSTTAPGPYTLRLYSDNPLITLVATQSGSPEARFVYNWLTACSVGTPPNRPPVARPIPDLTLLQGQAFSLELADYITDPDGQPLTFSATGLPAELSLSGSRISGTAATTSVSTITIKALDPAGLDVTTQFQLTVTPIISTPAGFTIVGVTTVSCQTLSTGQRQVQFLPQYGGLTGQPVTFQVTNELAPTQQAGPYTLNLYTDNPLITLQATQAGSATLATFRYDWLAGCGAATTPPTPTNRAPVVSGGVSNQTATLGQSYTLFIPGGTFTDPDGDALILSATGLPAGLTFWGSTLTGTPATTGVSTVSLTALDPAGLSASLTFTLTVVPAATTPPGGDFGITGVTTVNCAVISAGQRRISFTPQYRGVSGFSISFSVVNELSPTTAPGPYSLLLYTDNPVITLQAQQGSSLASYRYDWLVACSASGRQGAPELSSPLQVTVLGNPVVGQQVIVEVRGAEGQPLQLTLTNLQGQVVSKRVVEEAGSVETQSLPVSAQPAGLLLLRVSTPTQSQILKVLNR